MTVVSNQADTVEWYNSLVLIQQLGQHSIYALRAVIVYTGNYMLWWYEPHKLSEFCEATVFAVRYFISAEVKKQQTIF
jgi:kynurenine formamidase